MNNSNSFLSIPNENWTNFLQEKTTHDNATTHNNELKF